MNRGRSAASSWAHPTVVCYKHGGHAASFRHSGREPLPIACARSRAAPRPAIALRPRGQPTGEGEGARSQGRARPPERPVAAIRRARLRRRGVPRRIMKSGASAKGARRSAAAGPAARHRFVGCTPRMRHPARLPFGAEPGRPPTPHGHHRRIGGWGGARRRRPPDGGRAADGVRSSASLRSPCGPRLPPCRRRCSAPPRHVSLL